MFDGVLNAALEYDYYRRKMNNKFESHPFSSSTNWSDYLAMLIWDALRKLVPFVQFIKREKNPLRSVTFSKVAGCSLQLY